MKTSIYKIFYVYCHSNNKLLGMLFINDILNSIKINFAKQKIKSNFI